VGGTPTTLRTIEVGTNPSEVAISRRLREAYVVNSGSLSVVRLGSGRVLATIPTGNGDPQVAVALGRGGRRAYVGAPDSPYVSVVDTAQRTVIDNSVLVGNGTIAIATARTAAGPRAYLAQLEQSRLGVLDTSTDQLTGYVALPRGPQSVDVAPNGKALWVGSSYSGRIWVVRMSDQKIARTIRVNRGGPVSSVAFSPDGRQAWVSGLGGVSVVNVRTGALLHFMPAPALFPRSSNLNLGPLTLNGRGTRAYVVNTTFPDHPGRGALRVIRTRDYRIAGAAGTGIEPASVTAGPRGTAYVANYGSGTVSQMRIKP
jgi:DNA-binding beta-propeller fold protein YncE